MKLKRRKRFIGLSAQKQKRAVELTRFRKGYGKMYREWRNIYELK